MDPVDAPAARRQDGEQAQETSPYNWPRVAALSVLGAAAACLVGVIVFLVPAPNRNQLALGSASAAEIVEIAVQPPIELDYRSQDEVAQLRQDAVERHPELLLGEYRLSEAVFGQIEDRLPWWGLLGLFYYGSGEQSIEGPSEESRFLLNPYLLVAADFYHHWRHLPEAEILRPGFALDCPPVELRWFPPERRADATYNADCVSQTNARRFDLIAYNARDLNLNYAYVSYEDSRNITKIDPPAGPYAIPHYLHRGGSCGFPGGCNNMSPPSPEIDGLEITGFPAILVVRLWHQAPESVAQAPDLLFILRFL